MALIFNNTEITRLYYNGTEKMSLQYNGVGYFGKRFSLTKNTSTGVTLTVTRTSSPNQRAATGTISPGNTIYYGDVITISVAANSNYTNPKLYVNTGSGMTLRNSPYSFTVSGDVTYYGTATQGETWQTVWSGSTVITSGTEIAVPGLGTTNREVQLTATVTFEQWYISQETGAEIGHSKTTGSINRALLPTTVYGRYATMQFERSENKIVFTAKASGGSYKGYIVYEAPMQIEITEVREKK